MNKTPSIAKFLLKKVRPRGIFPKDFVYILIVMKINLAIKSNLKKLLARQHQKVVVRHIWKEVR